jgi:membrane protein YdbS with pleckstrin-like domain
MLSEKDLSFLEYWEKVRIQEATFQRKILAGLPFAALFCLPIMLLLIVVNIFLPDWFAKVAPTHPSTYIVIFLALVIAIFFMAYLRMHFRWEMNEQHYLELKAKQKKLTKE